MALIDAFLHGLSEKIKHQLVSLVIPEDLDSVIALTNKIDRHLQERDRFKTPEPINQVSTIDEFSSEPMQVGRTKLSATERARRFK